MTLSTRNTVLIFGLFVILIILIIYCFILFSLLSQKYPVFNVNNDLLINIGITFFLGLFSLIGWYIIRSYFSKTTSPEMFFFSFFLVSLSFEMIRIIHYYFFLQNSPLILGILFTRVIFFGRFFGLLCLFFSGLFSSWLDIQRIGIVVSISILFCFTLAFSIPIDTDLGTDFLYSPGIRNELFLVRVCLEVFAALNYLFSSIVKKSSDYFFLALSMSAVILGRELLLTSVMIQTAAAGGISLLLGSVFFGRKIRDMYLWI